MEQKRGRRKQPKYSQECKEWGYALRAAFAEKRMTCLDVANACNLAHSQVNRWFSGSSISIASIIHIEKCTGINLLSAPSFNEITGTPADLKELLAQLKQMNEVLNVFKKENINLPTNSP